MRSRTAALLAFALGLSAGLGGCKSPGAAPDAGAVASVSPVPAPAGLIAEAFLPTPDATWARARAIVGGPAVFMPASAGGLVVSVLSLPMTVAGEIDGDVPMLGAVVEAPERPRPRAVIGIHVKEGGRFLDQLTRGEAPRFRAKPDPATSITLLEPKEGASPLAMGVLGNYLLVSADAQDLAALGPYVARTMSQAPMPKEDLAFEVPRTAIEGPVMKAAQGAWAKLRGPDEAPRPGVVPLVPTIEGAIAILGDLERARVTLVLDDAAHLRISGVPRPGDGAASRAAAGLDVGDVKPLLDLPADTLAGFLLRDSAASRAEDIAKQVDAIARIVQGDLPWKDRERLTSALRAASDARGSWFAAGLRFDGTGPTAYVRSDVRDQTALEAAASELLDVASGKPIKASLESAGIRLSSGKTVVERLAGDVHRVRFERLDAAKPPALKKAGAEGHGRKDGAAKAGASQLPSAIDLLYLVKSDGLFASAGYDPGEGLRRVVAAPGGQNLGSVTAVKAALAPLGADIAFALFVEPLQLVANRAGKPDAGEPAPVVIAAGATRGAGEAPTSLWARADITNAAIRELVRYRGAF